MQATPLNIPHQYIRSSALQHHATGVPASWRLLHNAGKTSLAVDHDGALHYLPRKPKDLSR